MISTQNPSCYNKRECRQALWRHALRPSR